MGQRSTKWDETAVVFVGHGIGLAARDKTNSAVCKSGRLPPPGDAGRKASGSAEALAPHLIPKMQNRPPYNERQCSGIDS